MVQDYQAPLLIARDELLWAYASPGSSQWGAVCGEGVAVTLVLNVFF